VGANDEYNGKREDPELIFMPDLLGYQEKDPGRKKHHRGPGAMVFFKAMPEGPESDHKSQRYHADLKTKVINDIDAKYG